MGACITPHPHPQCPRESNMKSSAEGAVVCSENKRKDISSTGEGGTRFSQPGTHGGSNHLLGDG